MAYKLDGSGNLVGDDGKLVQIDGTNIVLSGYKTQEEVNSGLKDRLDRAAKKYETRIAQLEEEADASWLWKGLHAKLVDGFTFTMPDTPANQAVFPQQKSQMPGIGFV